MKKTFVLFVVLLLTNGCSVGPNYKRPLVDVPGSFRTDSGRKVTQTESTSPQTPQPEALSSRDGQPASDQMDKTSLPSDQSFGDQKWWEVFQDPQLQELI